MHGWDMPVTELSLQKSELISLLGIYSQRETFHINQHQTRSNYFMGLVTATLAFTFLSYVQYQEFVSIFVLSLVPLITIGLSQVAILSLARTYDRVNASIATRLKIENVLLLHLPAPIEAEEG